MATLAEAVDAAETDWLVSADIPDSVDYLTVESEVVQVTATFPAQYQARDGSTSEPRIRVVRAAGGTTAASHADGTTLTPLIPPSASSGGAAEPVIVDNQSDPPTPIVTLIIPSATISGDEATVAPDLGSVLTAGNDAGSQAIIGLADPTDPQDAATKAYADAGPFRVSAVDPGAIGAGRIWVNPAHGSGDDETAWQRRNAANDDWELPFLFMGSDGRLAVTGNGTADLVLENALATVTVAADGAVTVAQDGTPVFTIAADGTMDIGGIIAIDPAVFTVEINGTLIDGDGNITFGNIATADPGGGVVWSNAGVLTIGAGV